MGPQLYRCGNSKEVTQCRTQDSASMGPQLYRCGNSAASLRGHLVVVVASMGPQLYRCGNSAYLLMPPTSRPPASMGPQLYRCGNRPVMPRIADSCVGLQWGRNFIVAETGKLVIAVREKGIASMGPQLYRCGNGRRASASRRARSCFNGAATLSLRKPVALAPDPDVYLRASMGPQLYRCGNKRTARSSCG